MYKITGTHNSIEIIVTRHLEGVIVSKIFVKYNLLTIR